MLHYVYGVEAELRLKYPMCRANWCSLETESLVICALQKGTSHQHLINLTLSFSCRCFVSAFSVILSHFICSQCLNSGIVPNLDNTSNSIVCNNSM